MLLPFARFAVRRWLVLLAALPLFNCAGPKSAYTREHVARRLQTRTGAAIGPARAATAPAPALPNLTDGLSEPEAVALALSRNPAFQADLATLALAQADLRDAGLLANPVLMACRRSAPPRFRWRLPWLPTYCGSAPPAWAPLSSKPSAWPRGW